MNTHRYLRFVQAIALAATLPACAGAGEQDSPGDSPDAQPATTSASAAPLAQAMRTAQVRAEAATDTPADAAGDVDASHPFSSGPIVPPELPASFA